MMMRFHDKPKKQGGLYSLNLGQNNGPFLPKDIMLSNKRSMKLLAGNEMARNAAAFLLNTDSNFYSRSNTLLEPRPVYDDSIKDFTNYDEKYKSRLNAAMNLTASSGFQSNTIRKLMEELAEYKALIQLYKNDLKSMNDEVNRKNIENIKEIQPMLREFHHKLKNNLHEEKNENYKLLRELEQLNREKQQIQQQILFSHKRIYELEKFVGLMNDKKAKSNVVQEDNSEIKENSEDQIAE